MKISLIVTLLALISPCVSAIKGTRKNKVAGRRLKGDKDDEDDGDLPIPDLEDLPCFSEKATVQVQGASTPISMKDISVGDYVLTNDGSYQQVYAWGHRNTEQKANFYQLYYNDEAPLELTGEHLVYLDGKENPVRADSIQVGDVLKSNNGSAEIKKIQQLVRVGVYTPLTTTGKLVVDDIHSSSYISLQKNAPEFIQIEGVDLPMSQQDFVHLTLSPFRMVCKVMDCDSYNQDGMPHYVANGIQLEQWAETLPVVVQIVFLAAVLLLAGACRVLENSMGLPLLVATAYVAMKFKGIRSSQKCKTV